MSLAYDQQYDSRVALTGFVYSSARTAKAPITPDLPIPGYGKREPAPKMFSRAQIRSILEKYSDR